MDIEDIVSKPKELSTEQLNLIRDELLKKEFDTIFNFIKDMNRKFKINCTKIDLIKIYNSLSYDDYDLKKKLIKKVQKSQSGIISVTVLTSGTPEYINSSGEVIKGTFSCLHNCSYCPNEKPSEDNGWVQQPRSYLFTEPAVLRANQNGFDPIRQMNARISSLINMGHQVDKIELLVLGGTWSEYPKEYQEQFITKLYYAANIFYDIEKRDVLSLEEELLINETAKIHIIGLTLEMRSDSININEIKRLRRFNCTRVQLGIQHTDNEVLKMNNRGESVEKVKKAIRLLKDNCYKIDGHIMLNLYGSSVEKDEKMLNLILNDPDLQLDQLKIYPCAIVPFTKIKELYEKGEYKPYEDKYLYELIKNFKIKITKQFRINRIIRDISGHYIIGGYSQQFTSIRQVLENDMRANGWKCNCIRCREIKGNVVNYDDIKLEVLEYSASYGKEFFISFETDKYLIGFIRLRIVNVDIVNQGTVLENCGLIRELHVYSTLSNVGNNDSFSLQHKGYGRKLIEKAEEITKSYGIQKMAIIAGTGVRNYYRKYGYELVDTYMIKTLI
jgi:ELP3 family radical SAM enzyme/protein acetyltransferase